jgi:transcriptional regulator with AAA-type ATPase domain
MDTMSFWDEEMRSFPHGSDGVAFWVVRREGLESGSPLHVLYAWATGKARHQGMAARPPLGRFLQVMTKRKEELAHCEKGKALWVEPLLSGSSVRGCLGIWFQAKGPWREAVFLWAQRLAARLAPVLDQLASVPTMSPGEGLPWQPTLFPLPKIEWTEDRRGPNKSTKSAFVSAREIRLPRPLNIPGIPGCVGVSEEMQSLGQRLGGIARSGVNVLLSGESGTGKEIIAQALHLRSHRNLEPFVGQNCAALPESLFESELFGHKSGAFTGAQGDKQGLLASASGGTFFLDEIGDMPLSLQIKLLRVMQERKIRRIGDLKSVDVDIRFVSATHKDLQNEIDSGRFRLDLFYRLKVVNLVIPPLRHRPEDILPLLSYFLEKGGRPAGRITISEEALHLLHTWRWPGNVRELENEALRFLALYPSVDRIKPNHLSMDVQVGDAGLAHPSDLGTLRKLDQANQILEQYLIRKAIAAADGRKAMAARQLGLSRQGLYKKIARYGMDDLIETREPTANI